VSGEGKEGGVCYFAMGTHRPTYPSCRNTTKETGQIYLARARFQGDHGTLGQHPLCDSSGNPNR